MIAQDVPGATVTSRRRGILVSEQSGCLRPGTRFSWPPRSSSPSTCARAPSSTRADGALEGCVLVTALWLAIGLVVDAYDLHAAVSARGIFRVVATTVALEAVALLAVFFIVPFEITRPTILIWVPVSGLTVLCWRLGYRRFF